MNWNDNPVAIFEADLEPTWVPVLVHFYYFCLHGRRSRRQKIERDWQWYLIRRQIGFKDGGQITVSYRFSLDRVHCYIATANYEL